MKRKKLAALFSSILMLSGCQSLPASPVLAVPQPEELTLAIPANSPELVKEVSRELARRTEDFAENTLSVQIKETEDIWEAITRGEADLAMTENNRIAEHDSYLAMIEYPYFFQSSGYLVSGLNDPSILSILNYSLEPQTPMVLKRAAYWGTMDLVAEDTELLTERDEGSPTLTIAVKDQVVGETFEAAWNVTLEVRKEPLNQVKDGLADLAEVDLTRDIGELKEETVILSGHRLKVLDFFADEERMAELTPKQRAAIEESIVYAAGYSRTLADDAEEKVQEQLDEQAMAVISVNKNNRFSQFQEKYLAGQQGVDVKFLRTLRQKANKNQ